MDDGWVYRETPWIEYSLFIELIEFLGENSVKVVGGSRMQVKGEDSVTIKCFISPEGMKKLNEYSNTRL